MDVRSDFYQTTSLSTITVIKEHLFFNSNTLNYFFIIDWPNRLRDRFK